MESPPLHICYFDLEIRRTVEECGGWDEVKKTGGVSMLCIWDSLAERPFFYDDHTLAEAADHLERAKVAVSFNGAWFDIPLLQNHLDRAIQITEHIDLFAIVRNSLGDNGKGFRGHGLDALARNTLGKGKTGIGEAAPLLGKAGHWAELTNYCLSDVLLTRDLSDFIRKEGYVIDASGERLAVRVPEWFKTKN